MAKKTVLASPLIVLFVVISFHFVSDLKGLVIEAQAIHVTLMDTIKVLHQNPSKDEVQTVRLRLQQSLDDIRMLSVKHPLATAITRSAVQRETYTLFDLALEWAPLGGRDQAASLTGGRACCFSYC